MARPRLPVAPHLPRDEVARRYRARRDGREEARWQLIRLLTRPGRPPAPAEAAARVGLTPARARTIPTRWDAEGPAGLADRREATNGGRAELTPGQPAALYAAPRSPPPDGGPWAGPKLAASARGRDGVTVCEQTGREWLRRLGLAPQAPRPSHPEAAAPAEQRARERRPGRSGRGAAPRPPR